MDNSNPGLSLSGPSVDLTKVSALNHRRSVTFINHFIIHTVNFLNNFAAVTEEQLAKQSLELQKLEIAMNILEAKLASIPGLDDVVETTKEAKEPAAPADSKQDVAISSAEPAAPQQEIAEEPVAAVAENVVTVRQDARYARFLKMVTVGVPKAAIANKMKLEGLDPELLDTPDAPVPDAVAMEESDDNESESLSSGDDFSD